MATRDDIRVAWVDVASGGTSLPRDRPARLIVERATVACIEVPAVAPFFIGTSAVVHPEGAVALLSAAFAFVRDNPTHPLLALGHCQSKSTQAKVLSQQRAENIVALLKGVPWGYHAQDHHNAADVQRTLAWVAATQGIPCEPGPITGKHNGATQAALDAYRKVRVAGLSGEPGEEPTVTEQDWESFAGLFDNAVIEALGMEHIDLANLRGDLRFVGAGSIGCGHTWSLQPVAVHDYRPSEPVRVDLMFFPEQTPPLLALEKTAGESVYRERNYACETLPVDGKSKASPGSAEGSVEPRMEGNSEQEANGTDPLPPPLEEVDDDDGELTLDSVTPEFDPSDAPLQLHYTTRGRIDSARLEVRTDTPGAPALFARPLALEERSAGAGVLEWDGRLNTRAGAALGGALTSDHSPYRIQVVYDDGGGHHEHSNALTFEVR